MSHVAKSLVDMLMLKNDPRRQALVERVGLLPWEGRAHDAFAENENVGRKYPVTFGGSLHKTKG